VAPTNALDAFKTIPELFKEAGYFIEAFSLYEKGMLPFKGNIGDQPNKIIEVFNLISHARRRHTKD